MIRPSETSRSETPTAWLPPLPQRPATTGRNIASTGSLATVSMNRLITLAESSSSTMIGTRYAIRRTRRDIIGIDRNSSPATMPATIKRSSFADSLSAS